MLHLGVVWRRGVAATLGMEQSAAGMQEAGVVATSTKQEGSVGGEVGAVRKVGEQKGGIVIVGSSSGKGRQEAVNNSVVSTVATAVVSNFLKGVGGKVKGVVHRFASRRGSGVRVSSAKGG